VVGIGISTDETLGVSAGAVGGIGVISMEEGLAVSRGAVVNVGVIVSMEEGLGVSRGASKKVPRSPLSHVLPSMLTTVLVQSKV
jgi:hypothetical protein